MPEEKRERVSHAVWIIPVVVSVALGAIPLVSNWGFQKSTLATVVEEQKNVNRKLDDILQTVEKLSSQKEVVNRFLTHELPELIKRMDQIDERLRLVERRRGRIDVAR